MQKMERKYASLEQTRQPLNRQTPAHVAAAIDILFNFTGSLIFS